MSAGPASAMHALAPQASLVSLGSLRIPRVVVGLWQLSGAHGDIDPRRAAEELAAYVAKGFTAFDAADHYGPAETVLGAFRSNWLKTHSTPPPVQVFTKWVPRPGPMPRALVDQAIQRSLARMAIDSLDLLQFHWWDYDDPEYLTALKHMKDMMTEGKIKNLALTNFDTARLEQIVAAGIPIVSNQVQFSLLDRRPLDKMVPFCLKHDIKLLAYGSVAGGFLSERFLDAPPPRREALDTASLGKYSMTVQQFGGWALLQQLLSVLKTVADKHNVDIANVACRWVLDQPTVAAVIVGARLSISSHLDSTLRVFELRLDDADRAAIDAVLAKSKRLPGDCGDEYRY